MGWYDDYPDNWDEIRHFVYQRDDYTCQKCGARGGPYGDVELHAHHIVPKSQDGSHHPNNLATICWRCHNAEHDHHVPKMSEVSKQRDRSRSSRSRGTPGHTPDEMDEVTKRLRDIYTGTAGETDSTSTASENDSTENEPDWEPRASEYTCPNCGETMKRTGWFPYFHHFRDCSLPSEKPEPLSESQWTKVRDKYNEKGSSDTSSESSHQSQEYEVTDNHSSCVKDSHPTSADQPSSNSNIGTTDSSEPTTIASLRGSQQTQVNSHAVHGIFVLWIATLVVAVLGTFWILGTYGRYTAVFFTVFLSHICLLVAPLSIITSYVFDDGPKEPLPRAASVSKTGYVVLGLLSVPSGLFIGGSPLALDIGYLSITSCVVFMLSLSLAVLLGYRSVEDTISVSRVEETLVITAITVLPIYLLAHLLGFVGPAQLTVVSQTDYVLLVCVFVLLALTSLPVSAKVT